MEWTEKVLRLKEKRTISELARASGLSQSAMSTAINSKGSGNINSKSGILLAEALGVSAHWLFDDSKGMDQIALDNRVGGDEQELKAWCNEIQAIAQILIDEPKYLDELHRHSQMLIREYYDRLKEVESAG